jgi:hypothetical protein
MGHTSFANAAAFAAVVGIGWASQARADVIVETFDLATVNGYVSDNSSFSKFDPSLGVLHSVFISFLATANFSNSLANATNEVQYDVSIDATPLRIIPLPIDASRIGDGSITALFTQPLNDTAFNLDSFVGAGTISFSVQIVRVGITANDIFSAFDAETVTYDYTPTVQPPSGVPEAPSIAVLGVGLLGLGWTVRHREVRGGQPSA